MQWSFHWRIMAAATLVLALVSSSVGYAQQTMNAQTLTPQGVALTAAELGPEWTEVSRNSSSFQGSLRYDVIYASPAGRTIDLTTVVASSTDLAEESISALRYFLGDVGMSIVSVQNEGFGDGRAFKAQCLCGGKMRISYLFRVRQLVAWVEYMGAPEASDVQAQALAVARKQEGKFFAVFAPPPPPAPTATPVPTPAPTPAPAAVVAPPPAASAPVAEAPASDPYCRPGEQPQFRFGFARLQAELGTRMGNPTSCEYGDPGGSGDTLQNTSSGLGFYRQRSNTPTFTTGFEHWAITADGIVYWTGDSIDPPSTAQAYER